MQDMFDGDMNKLAIWARVLESRQQKGLPYIFFSDNINRNKPQVYKDKNLQIYSSNLCSEIALPSSYDESFICCLSSMNLDLYDEWKDTGAVRLAIFSSMPCFSTLLSRQRTMITCIKPTTLPTQPAP